jgi:hypothetical protein
MRWQLRGWAHDGAARCPLTRVMITNPAHRFFLGTWAMAGFLSENRPIRCVTRREGLQSQHARTCCVCVCVCVFVKLRAMPHAPHACLRA